jgi:hypothetical protein
MTYEEIGHIYNFLLKKRVARSYKVKNVGNDERYISSLLDRNVDAIEDLQSFLASQQLRLEILDAQAYNLGGQGYAFVLIPSHTDTEILPTHLRTKELWDAVKDNTRSEVKFTSVVWTSYLYLHLLYALYTQENRPIEAISTYKDTWVTEDDFSARVIEEIEAMRTDETSSDNDLQTIASVLTDASVTDISKRITRFLSAMERFSVLEKRTAEEDGFNFQESDKYIYTQTLWSAVDIARNFYRNASLVLTLPRPQNIKSFSE